MDPDSILDDVLAAAEAVGGGDNEAVGDATPDVSSVGEGAAGADAVGAVEGDLQAGDAAGDTSGAAAGGRARGPDGKFIPKAAATAKDEPAKPQAKAVAATKAPPPATPAAAAIPPPAAAAPAAAALRAPPSWKPAAREHFASLPPAVQEEAIRIDREVKGVMQESAADRKFAADFRQVTAPFEAMIRAEGSEPLRTYASLLQTAAALRTAPPAHKAHLIAGIVRQYGVPLDALAAAIDGEPAPQGANHAPAQYQDPRVDQLLGMLQQSQQARAQAEQQRQAQELEAFLADEKASEFYGDLEAEIRDVQELARKRGSTLPVKDAYNRAVALAKLDEKSQVSQVFKQREAAVAAKANIASTQRAKAAASSVRSQPAGAVPAAKGGSDRILDDVLAAAAAISGR